MRLENDMEKNKGNGFWWRSIVVMVIIMYLLLSSDSSNNNLSDSSSKGKFIKKEQFGSEWAFSVDSGYIYKRKGCALFNINGVEYALNGTAEAAGYSKIDKFWLDNPDMEGTKISIGPFIDLASQNEID